VPLLTSVRPIIIRIVVGLAGAVGAEQPEKSRRARIVRSMPSTADGRAHRSLRSSFAFD